MIENAWLVGILSAVLILAFLIFLILYARGFFRPRTPYRVINFPKPEDATFAFTLATLSDSAISQGKFTDFWVGADQIFAARMDAIRKAQHSIQFETYVFTPGRRADDFAKAIAQKVQEGVTVQILADNFGAKDVPLSYWRRLQAAGVQFHLFNRFSWRDPLYHLRRNHRKLLLIDQKMAFIGGAGMSDHWDGLEEIGDRAPWLDYEVCFQGEMVTMLRGIFLQHWLDAGGTADFSRTSIDPSFHSDSHPPILITAGEDPTLRDSGIRALYQSLIQAAQQRVWIASPYFLPDATTCKVLRRAKHNGVDVRILTMGPANDKPFIRYTSRALYDRLLKSEIEIYEYQPSMMHAKMLLIDSSWVSFGSANFDPRSFFQNDELNLCTPEQDLIERMESLLQTAFTKSDRIRLKDWQRRELRERLIARFSLLFYWQL